ncbi:hypothetical protein SKAU_G00038400 [Synaphobranchus kaupii]|uniref:Type II inositol 3,4-bisphosphate 4-phosphatase n=1 Tax=Synaphobranchus kaupii TaxID=118154 RepID=A0A9Q1GFS8_SYNKA|nr:hypothetical protein SKAU_G00038400 [Synaphobranchus kaupii]
MATRRDPSDPFFIKELAHFMLRLTEMGTETSARGMGQGRLGSIAQILVNVAAGSYRPLFEPPPFPQPVERFGPGGGPERERGEGDRAFIADHTNETLNSSLRRRSDRQSGKKVGFGSDATHVGHRSCVSTTGVAVTRPHFSSRDFTVSVGPGPAGFPAGSKTPATMWSPSVPPAAHFQGFKNGGLQRLLSRFEGEKKNFSTAYQCIYYTPENTAKAKEVLTSIGQLQPLISSLADQLMQAARQHSPELLKGALKTLSDKTEQFVHALKDELVKNALLALHTARPGYVTGSQPPGVSNNVQKSEPRPKEDGPAPLKSQDSIPHHSEYDEEEWDRVWANVAKSLNCIIAMVDRLQEHDNNNQEPSSEQTLADVITSHSPGDWQEQIYPLVVTLKDCVTEVVDRATKSMTFVLLQEAACSIPQGLFLKQRRDIVFSQALAALACGFVMRLYTGLEDHDFLQQLHLVGLIAQFESLLSTYSDEIGMLEDMEVGISDLQRVTFKITEAKSDDPGDLQPIVSGRREFYTVEVPLPHEVFQALPEGMKEGKPLQVYPVLFNVGINQQQTLAERFGDISSQERINQKNFEILDGYYKSLSDKIPLQYLPCFQTQTDLKELLETLGQNIMTKKRKNVEILWLAGTICRRLNGVRFTSCKSAKDRTSMSVTLEQCALLRDEHELNKDYFIRALDCMRREGCRIENVHKNIKCRKYAFNMLQLMAFPKFYRPPEGTYGK